MEQSSESIQLSAKQGLYKLSYGNVSDAVKLMYFKDQLDLSQLDDLDLFNISKFKKTKDGFEIEVFDRQKAIEALSNLESLSENHLGMDQIYDAISASTSITHNLLDVGEKV